MILVYTLIFGSAAWLIQTGQEFLGCLEFLAGLVWLGCDLYKQEEV